MLIEAKYYRKNRHNCNWDMKWEELFEGNMRLGTFEPIVVESIHSIGDDILNIIISNDPERQLFVRRFDEEKGVEEINDTSIPILLFPGQILELTKETWSVDLIAYPSEVALRTEQGTWFE